MSNLAHSSRPEIQARRMAAQQDPEWQRRRTIYLAAKGLIQKQQVANWNADWNIAGRPADFPDFPEWLAEQNGGQR
jgi:hypothetical protein